SNKVRECCCAPSFIIAIAGPWICVLGCIFLEKVVVQPLTDFIPLTINIENYDQLERIARLFQALYIALCNLEDFYTSLNLIPSDQRYFPYFNQYQIEDNKIISFVYLYQFDDSKKFTWKAKTADGQMIVIKFVRNYNVEAHQLCSKNKMSPLLLYFNRPDELRKFYIIITDFVTGITLSNKNKINQRFYQDIRDHSRSIINFLHKKNLVFANLQPSNILFNNSDNSDEQYIMLISFDCCGEHMVERYPPSVRNDNLPPGAGPGALLNKAHDIYWLDKLWEFLISE
ncbi:3573_t:CDS:1, partial [Scutellospora calospora]